MAYRDSQGGSARKNIEKIKAYSDRVWRDFTAKHKDIDRVRTLTRLQQVAIDQELSGGKLRTVKTAKAYAILQQWRAFSNSRPDVQVLPRDNSDGEKNKTERIEKWLGGVERQLNRGGAFPFRHALWHAGESGVMALRLLFDADLAEDGRFPFLAKALDPRNLAYRKADNNLLCVILREKKPAEVLLEELVHAYEKAEGYEKKNKPWAVPESFRRWAEDNAYEDVECQWHYDNERETLWVQGYGLVSESGAELVWDKPHGMPGMPIVLGFLGDIPSEKPEEQSMGMISPVYDALVNERILLDKMTAGAGYFFLPSLMVKQNGGYRITQALPGNFYEAADDAKEITLNPNDALVKALMDDYGNDIEKATLSEMAFSFLAGRTSGYSLQLQMQGLTQSLADKNLYPELVLEQFYSMLLKATAYFNTPAMAKVFADDPATYSAAFQTYDLNRDYEKGTVKKVLTLSAKDIDDHFEVEVSLKPELPNDMTQLYQVAGVAKQLGMPDEYIDTEILKVKNPAQLTAWRAAAKLEQENPVYAKYVQMQSISEIAERDPDFAQFLEHEQQMEEAGMGQDMQGQGGPQPQQPPGQGTPENPQSGQDMMGGIPGEGQPGMSNGASFGIPPGAPQQPGMPPQMR